MPRLPDFTPPPSESYTHMSEATRESLLNSAALRQAAEDCGTILPKTDEQLIPGVNAYITGAYSKRVHLEGIAEDQANRLIEAMHKLYRDQEYQQRSLPFGGTPFNTILERSYNIGVRFSLLPKDGPAIAAGLLTETDALANITLEPDKWLQPNKPQKRYDYTSYADAKFRKSYGPEHGCPAHEVLLKTPEGRQTSLFMVAWEGFCKKWLEEDRNFNEPYNTSFWDYE